LRRRGGPLPSAGGGPDNRSILHIDSDRRTLPDEPEKAGGRPARIGIPRIVDLVLIRH
jgi:hypothetical protein